MSNVTISQLVLGLLLLGACLCASPSTRSVLADDETAPAGVAVTTTKGASAANAPAERVLLLHNGKVVQGTIQQGSTGYVVIKPEGRLVLPFEQVRLEADDVEDAYRQQHNALPDHSAAAHTELARWCLTYGLKDQARAEIHEALRREPGSLTAKNMLQRIDDQLLATKELPMVKAKNGQYSLLGDVKPLETVEALGGLPREAANEFVSKVQPLLVNRCATAGCHGPGSDNPFELQRAKLGKGSPKSYSERNLAAVLARIDRDRPASSPLLTKLRGDSKTTGAKPSHGGLSHEQTQIVRNWIVALAHKSPTTTPSRPMIVTNAATKSKTLRSEEDSPETDSTTPDKALPLKPPAKNLAADSDADDNVFRQLLRERKPDAFDPDEFNRNAVGERETSAP